MSDTAGAATWQYTASSNQAAFGVDQARHAATATSGFTVDTFAAEVRTFHNVSLPAPVPHTSPLHLSFSPSFSARLAGEHWRMQRDGIL